MLGFPATVTVPHLCPMMELTVTSLHSNLKPPISLKELDEFFDLHARKFTPGRC